MQFLKGCWGVSFPKMFDSYRLVLKHFLQDRNKTHEEKIKFKANTIENEISLTTFNSYHIIISNNITFNVFIILISKKSASQTSVAIWSSGLRKPLTGNAS